MNRLLRNDARYALIWLSLFVAAGWWMDGPRGGAIWVGGWCLVVAFFAIIQAFDSVSEDAKDVGPTTRPKGGRRA